MQSIPVQIGSSLLRRDGKMLPHRMKRAALAKPDRIILLRFPYPITCPQYFSIDRTMQGLHLTADCYDCRCPPGLLLDPIRLREFVMEHTLRSGLTVVGEKFHPFQAADGSAAGVTCALLLAESHLAIHTWPERQAVTLDVYVCNFTEDNSAKASGLLDALVAGLAPARWQIHRLQRASCVP